MIKQIEHLSDGRKRSFLALAALFAAITALAAVDLVSDLGEGASATHLLTEGLLCLIGIVGLTRMLRGLITLQRDKTSLAQQAVTLARQLDASNAEAQRWRREAQVLLRGLSEAIDEQLERWQLTAAEKEVALLLLKGLSHKEIAGLRDTSDATARQQARSIYKKAGLSGRHDLAAFFLEDLLQPQAG